MRRDAEIGEDGQGEPPTPAKTTSSSLKVAGGGGRAAAEPVGPRWPPARPVLTGALLLGAYMPRCSGGARPTGGSALAKLAVLRGSPPGQGRAPPRLAGGSGGRRRSRLVLGGGGGGGSAAAAGGRDGSGGRRERERSGCARGGARWQQVSRRPPSPGCHLPPARDRRGCPGGTVGRSAGEGCGDGGWGEPGGGGRTGRVSSRLAATSGLAASPGGRRRGGGRGTGSPSSRNRPASPGTGTGPAGGHRTGQDPLLSFAPLLHLQEGKPTAKWHRLPLWAVPVPSPGEGWRNAVALIPSRQYIPSLCRPNCWALASCPPWCPGQPQGPHRSQRGG